MRSLRRRRPFPIWSAPTSLPTTEPDENALRGRVQRGGSGRSLSWRRAMKMGFRSQFLVLAGAAMLFIPAAGRVALADSPVETALRDFVGAIDASPGWTASFRHISYDAATDTAVL